MDIKELLYNLNSNKYGCVLDYIYLHRKDGSICERNMAKFFKNLGVEPVEVPGKIIELEYDNPGFRHGVYSCVGDTVSWESGDTRKFRVLTPGWRYDGTQFCPIELIAVD